MRKELRSITALWFRKILPWYVFLNIINSAVGFVVFFLYRNQMMKPNLWLAIGLWLISLISITLICLLIGRSILAPFNEFSVQLKKVAKGDFSTRINDRTKIGAIDEMYDDFNRMVEELSSIETLRSDFVANVSHEFKTPISAIEGYALLLQNDEILPEKRQEFLSKIVENTQNLSVLSGNILRLSGLEQRGFVEKKQFELDEQIRKVILSLEPEWEKKEISFDLDLPRTLIWGDEKLLYQVWYNLLHNAIKFSNLNGVISIRLHDSTVEIEDHGIGMSEEVKAHIFEKFYQGDNARQTRGNGLGLAIVKKIVDLSSGTISVLTKEGFGTTFTVNLSC